MKKFKLKKSDKNSILHLVWDSIRMPILASNWALANSSTNKVVGIVIDSINNLVLSPARHSINNDLKNKFKK